MKHAICALMLAAGTLAAQAAPLRVAVLEFQDATGMKSDERMGGAIAPGHPLGATGAIRAASVIHGLRRTGGKYGMVTMCVGAGQGAAGIFERL